MKRSLFFAIILSMLCLACSKYQEQDGVPSVSQYGELIARFAEDTRTYAEQGKYLRWHEADLLSVFYGSTANVGYKFNGKTGDSDGRFALILGETTGKNNPLDRIYAIYPQDKNAQFVGDNTIAFNMPTTQYHQSGSFGINTNAMVAVTADNQDNELLFQNLCGYLKVKIYGKAKIKQLTLRGNSGEKIAGRALVTAAYGQIPTLEMTSNAFGNITVNCGEGVEIAPTIDETEEFWFVIPPTTFEKGFTVTFTEVGGKTFTKSTNSRVVIGRNVVQPMEPLYVVCESGPVPVCSIDYTATEQISVPKLEDHIVSHNFDSTTGEGSIGLDYQLQRIEKNFFINNESITSVVIPEGVSEIEEAAFSWCQNLQEVTIPNSVCTIGFKAFQYTSIKRVNISSIDALCRISYGNHEASTPLYNKARLYLNGEEVTKLNIPNGVTEIDDYAFYGCQSIKEVNIPNSVTRIGYYSFSNCTNLEQIYIGENVTYVGQNAFATGEIIDVIHCRPLTPPEIPLTIVSDGSFYEPYSYHSNYGLATKIIVPAAAYNNYKTEYKDSYASSIYPDVEPDTTANNVIYYASKDGTVVTPNDIAYFGANIVSNSYENGWGKIVFDGDVTEIGISAFESSKLTFITIPQSVTIIGARAFANSSLSGLYIPASVTLIESDAFLKTYVNRVDIEDLSAWCKIEFDTIGSNPLSLDRDVRLYIDGRSLTDIVIPQDVTALKEYTFYNYTEMTSLNIHNGVKSIKKSAFYNCGGELTIDCDIADASVSTDGLFYDTNFVTIIIGDNVKSIGSLSFYGCKKVESITIGRSVERIGNKAFAESQLLKKVTLRCKITDVEVNPFYNSDKLECFEGEGVTDDGRCWIVDNRLMSFAPAGLTKYVVETGVTEIGNYAFYSCGSLESILLPAGLQKISPLAFYKCVSLQSINIPEGVTVVDNYAFYNCIKLTSIKLPNSVTSLGSYVFAECTKLVTATVAGNSLAISDYAFFRCPSLARVTISEGVTSIGYNAFANCTALVRLTIPQGVVTIKEDAFCGCTTLKSVTIPQSVTTIGESAFRDCSMLASVELGDQMSRVERYTFYNCSALESVSIGKNVTYIGESAFANCSNIQSVNISDLVSWFGISFYAKTANPISFGAKLYVNGVELNELIVPAGITKINNYAFCGYAGLTKIVGTSDVRTIGNDAFSSCYNLTSVNLEGVTRINQYAFNTCKSLQSVVLGDTISYIERYVFMHDDLLTDIYCKATTPPSVYYNSSNNGGSFTVGTALKIYVPRSAIEVYQQYATQTPSSGSSAAKNWSVYQDNLVPYDFQ